MDIKLIVATHKSYWMPDDDIYLPVHAGALGKEGLGYTRDDSGENISHKNKNYCELTCLYWAWKNLKADYIGLVHYRRHFAAKGIGGKKEDRVIAGKQLEAILKDTEAVVPLPRNYYIETNYSHYAHAHHAKDLDALRGILASDYPEYVNAYDSYMKSTVGHRFNMFVMRYDVFDAYCRWLFEILFRLEEEIDISDYDSYNSRVFGFISERLLDIWLETNKIKYKELPYIFMEKQNWIVKGFNFLKRKFVTGDR